MVSVLLFDFYGLFLKDAYSEWLRQNGLKRQGVYAELINQLDLGVIDEITFYSQLSELVGRPVARDEIHNNAELPDLELVNLIKDLKLEYAIGLLSNASPKLRVKLDRLQLTPLFDKIIISGEIGYAKPDQQVFVLAAAAFDTSPGSILFIDDNPANVMAATASGMSAIEYTTAPDLRAELQSILSR